MQAKISDGLIVKSISLLTFIGAHHRRMHGPFLQFLEKDCLISPFFTFLDTSRIHTISLAPFEQVFREPPHHIVDISEVPSHFGWVDSPNMPTEILPNNMAWFGKTFLPVSSA